MGSSPVGSAPSCPTRGPGVLLSFGVVLRESQVMSRSDIRAFVRFNVVQPPGKDRTPGDLCPDDPFLRCCGRRCFISPTDAQLLNATRPTPFWSFTPWKLHNWAVDALASAISPSLFILLLLMSACGRPSASIYPLVSNPTRHDATPFAITLSARVHPWRVHACRNVTQARSLSAGMSNAPALFVALSLDCYTTRRLLSNGTTRATIRGGSREALNWLK